MQSMLAVGSAWFILAVAVLVWLVAAVAFAAAFGRWIRRNRRPRTRHVPPARPVTYWPEPNDKRGWP